MNENMPEQTKEQKARGIETKELNIDGLHIDARLPIRQQNQTVFYLFPEQG